jgi:CHAT domain-containing protein
MLPRNATLIDYFRYDYMDAETEERTPMYAAVVLRKGRPARLFDLGEASPIDEHVDDYRQHMADVDYEGGKPSAVDVARYEEISASLYESIWRPIAETVGDAEMIIVAPDGALNMLAFGALEGESGDYLIESAMFHYLTSSRDLVRLNERFSAGTGLLAMGDPEYEPPEGRPAPPESSQDQEPVQVAWAAPAQASRGMYPTCDLFMNQRPAPLPGTRKEIETAADSWRKHSTEPAAVYLGKDASEAHFKHEAPGKRVIYLAAHGYLLGSSCASEASHRFGMEERYFARANPLLLSGLYLAGADETLDGKLEPGGEDGILTAYEVSGLDLRKSRLVILSACNTALGRIEEGEGTYGLRRAFQMAGARTVVSTLWPIPDEATSEMMGALYMSEDEPVAKALHRVQMDRLKALRARGESDHPYSWAAFIATGDWR